MATIKDLSQMTGLSLGTISNYINGRQIQQKNAVKIEEAIKALNYFPNNLGKHLRSGDTKTVGIVANDIAAPYISKAVAVLEKGLSVKKYKVLFCNSQNDLNLERENLDFMVSQAVSAIIVFPISYYQSQSNIENVLRAKLPIILCDSDSCLYSGLCHTVNYDNEQLAFDATELFIKEGHRNLACILGKADHYSSVTRLAGFRKALESNNIPFDEKNLYYCDFDNIKSYAATEKILNSTPRVTACLITVNNMMIGFLKAVAENGKTVGRDLSYITFSSEPYYDILPVKPTFIMHDAESLGRNALEILEDVLMNLSNTGESPIKKIVDSEIILGESHKIIPNP